MKIQTLLRNDFSKCIKPYVKEECCGECGCKDDLSVHHSIKFDTLLKETLDELGLPLLKEGNDYTQKELSLIRNKMKGKQMQIKYHTLCKSCHDKIHDREKLNQTLDTFIQYAKDKQFKGVQGLNEIAKELGVQKNTISVMNKELEEKGIQCYITSRKEPNKPKYYQVNKKR